MYTKTLFCNIHVIRELGTGGSKAYVTPTSKALQLLTPEPRVLRPANVPRGSIYTTTMESGLKKPSPLWCWGPNSRIAVYMDPLGYATLNSEPQPYKTVSPNRLHTLTQRAQYPLIKEYTLNNKGLHIKI